MAERLVKTRINENLLKVKNESDDVKILLSLARLSAKPKNSRTLRTTKGIESDIETLSFHTSRKDLLRIAVLLGTSRNTQAQQNLIKVISKRLNTINEKDYKYIAKLFYLKDPFVVDKVNAFLCKNIKGFNELYTKFYDKYYGI